MSGSSVESEDGRSTVATVVAGDGSSRNLLERAYPQEVWHRGEPCLRLERRRVLLARTLSMDALEARSRQFVILASALGDGEEVVTPAALLASIKACYGVLPSEVSIQVACPPHDLWMFFSTEEKCKLVLQSSMKFKCCRQWIQFTDGSERFEPLRLVSSTRRR
ncbi:hypothetical protein ZWY2020_039048 [Hordeum vulgare]|nr:hypothetical protein ZWY2020_039048 [Hordeum vulgare]